MENHRYWYALCYKGKRETMFRFETHAARDLFMSEQEDKGFDVKPVYDNSDVVTIALVMVKSRELDWSDGVVICTGERLYSDENSQL